VDFHHLDEEDEVLCHLAEEDEDLHRLDEDGVDRFSRQLPFPTLLAVLMAYGTLRYTSTEESIKCLNPYYSFSLN